MRGGTNACLPLDTRLKTKGVGCLQLHKLSKLCKILGHGP